MMQKNPYVGCFIRDVPYWRAANNDKTKGKPVDLPLRFKVPNPIFFHMNTPCNRELNPQEVPWPMVVPVNPVKTLEI